jgi:hypothetical protein
MADMKRHLVNPGRPRLSHLEDGYEDWQRFGFENIGVVKVTESGRCFRLVLSASDSLAAQDGLTKYRMTWNSTVRCWFFGREVQVEWQSVPKGEGGSKSLG